MTTAPLTTHAELDLRTRRAWDSYAAATRELSGTEYDEAERRSWDRLQRRLAEVEEERQELLAAGPARGRRR